MLRSNAWLYINVERSGAERNNSLVKIGASPSLTTKGVKKHTKSFAGAGIHLEKFQDKVQASWSRGSSHMPRNTIGDLMASHATSSGDGGDPVSLLDGFFQRRKNGFYDQIVTNMKRMGRSAACGATFGLDFV
ncbi:hypothetical protein FA13DRAFT_1709933 [Coprinellus micaceus]|uniref:Uncharacterized protein n=1 Tax=Coprinellus micaceus TaxID=71717 RepID=A0A4Y7TA81_COPMI|nr:hypothetical protein FA13DRAFT_1709933 [Coprinellus micaceus]